MRWRLKSPALLFAQTFVQAHIKDKIKIPRHWPLWGKSTGGFPSPRPVTWKVFLFDDVIMVQNCCVLLGRKCYMRPTDDLNHICFSKPVVIYLLNTIEKPLYSYAFSPSWLCKCIITSITIIMNIVVIVFAEHTPFMEHIAFTDAMMNGDPRGKQCVNIHYWEKCHTGHSYFALTCLSRRNIKLFVLFVENTFAT